MRAFCTVVIASNIIACIGCQNATEKRLVGEWVIDQPEELYEGVADGDEAGLMTLRFNGDGTLETVTDFPAAQARKTGTWKLESFDKDTNVAVVRCNIMSDDVETEITFLEKDRIRLIPPNIAVLDMEFEFRRKP